MQDAVIRSRRSFMLCAVALTVALAGCHGDEPGAHATAGASSQDKAHGPKPSLILATTTSTRDSGLLDALIPVFTASSGYTVKTIAVGSGRAIAMGERGEADVLLTHAPDAERAIVKRGAVIDRKLVMHNDFVLLGPKGDPAHTRGKTAVEALAAIHAHHALFLSRGDDSGTHKLEKKLWTTAKLRPAGAWYQESGSGMGKTLTIADQKQAYTLSDRGTFLALRAHLTLTVAVQGGAELMNPYHVMRVNPQRFTKVNREGAEAFATFLLSDSAQEIIASFGKEKYGLPLFHADAGKSEAELFGAS